jgi:hypothetical protein
VSHPLRVQTSHFSEIICETKQDRGGGHSRKCRLRVQDISLLEQVSFHYPIPVVPCQLQRSSPHTENMAQQLDLRQVLPCKLQPLISCSLDHSSLCDAPVSSHTRAQSQKGDSAAFDFEPRNSQEDCPDGGLQAWLVVLGVRLSA